MTQTGNMGFICPTHSGYCATVEKTTVYLVLELKFTTMLMEISKYWLEKQMKNLVFLRQYLHVAGTREVLLTEELRCLTLCVIQSNQCLGATVTH